MDWTRGRLLGRGSSATVSLATTLPSGDVFAVKSVEFSQSEMLQREQRILSSLNCSKIVGYRGFDIKEENGKLMYNLFMEYISGGTLSDAIMKQGGRLEESLIQSYTRGILKGIEYLHSNRLVHCDIKGRNVLIGCDGTKIADLGCAKWVDEVTGMLISGTPVFMAPEVVRGEEQGFPSDVWSIGCTVIEMATGHHPWPEVSDPVSALYRIAFSGDVPKFPSFLSEKAKDFLSRCLVRDPRERWTVPQLLKHPFLNESNSYSKQIQVSVSNSPTSILDQDFWASDSKTSRNLTQDGFSDFPAEKIRRLSGVISFSLPNWTWDESWVTVRGNNNEELSIFSGEDQNMSSSDDVIASSELGTVSRNYHEEETEFCFSSVFEEEFCNYSFYEISIISSRKMKRRGFSMACKRMKDDVIVSSDVNLEIHKENFPFLQFESFYPIKFLKLYYLSVVDALYSARYVLRPVPH